MEEALTLEQAAEVLRLHPETVRELLKRSLDGKLEPGEWALRGFKNGRRWLVFRDECEGYLRRLYKGQWS